MKLNEQQLPTRLKNFLDRYQIHSVKQLRDRLLIGGNCRKYRGCGVAMEKLINQIDGINTEEIKAQHEGRQKIKEALFELQFPNSANLVKKLCRWEYPDVTKKQLAELLLKKVKYFFMINRRGINLSTKSIANLILDSGMNPNDFFNAALENKKEYQRRANLSSIENKLNRIKKHLTLA